MRTLFVYPEFPKTFWSYEKILELVNRKVLLPPLGMVTVAALLPQEWEMKLVDRNVREVTEEEWNWAQLVIISGMIVQKDDMQHRSTKQGVVGFQSRLEAPTPAPPLMRQKLRTLISKSWMRGKSPCPCLSKPSRGGIAAVGSAQKEKSLM